MATASASRTNADWGVWDTDADSDDDGLSDGEEVHTHLTSPSDPDSDDDERSDGQEVDDGTNPLDPDGDDVRDGDGIPNGSDNCSIDSNPAQGDADKDGIGNACEVSTVQAACAVRVHVTMATFSFTGRPGTDPRPLTNGCWTYDRPIASGGGGWDRPERTLGSVTWTPAELWHVCGISTSEPAHPRGRGWWSYEDFVIRDGRVIAGGRAFIEATSCLR